MKILIYPFPKGMFGGDRPAEQTERLKHALAFWRKLSAETYILCAGGLADKHGLTLGEDMANELLEMEPTIRPWLIMGEQESAHTGHQVLLSESDFKDPRWDRIIIISSPWHVARIVCLVRNLGKTQPIVWSASPSSGSFFYRFSRAIQEIIMTIPIMTFDPHQKMLDRSIEKRRADARCKP